jgi:hypothetical protein
MAVRICRSSEFFRSFPTSELCCVFVNWSSCPAAIVSIPRGGLALATVTEAQHKRRMALCQHLVSICCAHPSEPEEMSYQQRCLGSRFGSTTSKQRHGTSNVPLRSPRAVRLAVTFDHVVISRRRSSNCLPSIARRKQETVALENKSHGGKIKNVHDTPTVEVGEGIESCLA